MSRFPLTCVLLRLTHIFRNSSCSAWAGWRGWRWTCPHPWQLSACWPGMPRVLVVLVGAGQRTHVFLERLEMIAGQAPGYILHLGCFYIRSSAVAVCTGWGPWGLTLTSSLTIWQPLCLTDDIPTPALSPTHTHAHAQAHTRFVHGQTLSFIWASPLHPVHSVFLRVI